MTNEKVWSKEKIIEAIEAHHWDHEPEHTPTNIEFINNEKVTMIKFAGSNSIYANKVVRQRFEHPDLDVQEVIQYFGEVPFSWWVGPNSKPVDLVERLTHYNFGIIDEYIGLAYSLKVWEKGSIRGNYKIVEVENDEQLWEQVRVSSAIWGYDEASLQSIFNQRKSYLQSPFRKGGFIVVLDGERGIGYSNYRYSSDGKVLYLNGSAVLPEYRGKGVYSDLVSMRLAEAKSRGCELVTCQARKGTSEPILRKLGFVEYGTYYHLAKKDK